MKIKNHEVMDIHKLYGNIMIGESIDNLKPAITFTAKIDKRDYRNRYVLEDVKLIFNNKKERDEMHENLKKTRDKIRAGLGDELNKFYDKKLKKYLE